MLMTKTHREGKPLTKKDLSSSKVSELMEQICPDDIMLLL